MMAFRADEERSKKTEYALNYLLHKEGTLEELTEAREKVLEIIEQYGPVVDTYPSWHPLVFNSGARHPSLLPDSRCGYRGLDHTIYLAHGFITCPYVDSDEVIAAVKNRPHHPFATVMAERLDISLYNSSTETVLVKCEWDRPLNVDNTIPKPLAVGLMLEFELPCWHWSEYGETWETMRPYIMGAPHGARSSLFVDQETGQAMKSIWNAIINTGIYGPIRV
ncbi:hypothetical protein [Vibrio jasicida]|uniref:hypothetical protein n=1 Tax=Vibrio jasicida TaxID=766224 RepID=UPI004067E77F